MAGKHVGSDTYVDALTHNAPMPGSKVNLAWAEGATGNPTPNPHTAGTPEALAYDAGVAANSQHEASSASTITVTLGLAPELVTGGSAAAADLPSANTRAISHQRDITATGGPFLAQTGDIVTAIGVSINNTDALPQNVDVAVYLAALVSGNNWRPVSVTGTIQTRAWPNGEDGDFEFTGLNIPLINGARYMAACATQGFNVKHKNASGVGGLPAGSSARDNTLAVAGTLNAVWTSPPDDSGGAENLIIWARVQRQA